MINHHKNKFLGIFFSVFFAFSGFTQSFFETTLLPEPTGPYAIGLLNLSLTDSSRTEKYTHHKSFRRIQIDIWYPSEKIENKEFTKYLDGFSSDLIYDIFKSKGIRLSLLDSVKQTPTHTFQEGVFPKEPNTFPVLIFSPGFYFGMAPLYSAFMENLASQGYIVCCVSHPYEQPYIRFTDGEEAFMKKKKSQLTYLELWWAYKMQFREPSSPEMIESITRKYLKRLKRFDKMLDLWMTDTEFVLDYFFDEKKNNASNALTQRMDLKKIGTFGQSFGGAVAGQLCLRDDRVIAGINLDGFQFGDIIDEPLQKPFMLIQSGYNELWNYGNSAIYKNHESEFYFLDIPKARHLVFSDACLIPDVSEINRFDMLGTVDAPKTLDGINKAILAFFDLFLKDKSTSLFSTEAPFEGAYLQIFSVKEK